MWPASGVLSPEKNTAAPRFFIAPAKAVSRQVEEPGGQVASHTGPGAASQLQPRR
jgi:hypothetical protein